MKFLSKVIAHEIRGTNFWDTLYFWKMFETSFENAFSVDGWAERRLFKNGDVRKNEASTDFVML